MNITNSYLLEKTKIIGFFLLAGGTLSCQNTKDLVIPMHTVTYHFEVIPLNKYVGSITYLNREGKLDSATTTNHWRYEFKAKKGTLLHASVKSKPIRSTDRVVGAVSLEIIIDGDPVYSGIGKSFVADYEIK